VSRASAIAPARSPVTAIIRIHESVACPCWQRFVVRTNTQGVFIMKATLTASHHHTHSIHLSENTRKILLGVLYVLVPYVIAALGVFIYHGQ
jgi:hypothetical protein